VRAALSNERRLENGRKRPARDAIADKKLVLIIYIGGN